MFPREARPRVLALLGLLFRETISVTRLTGESETSYNISSREKNYSGVFTFLPVHDGNQERDGGAESWTSVDHCESILTCLAWNDDVAASEV